MIMGNLNIGERAVVKDISLTGDIKRRLMDIGLIEGTKIECVLESPGGNPKAFEIRGAIIALRTEDCNNVEVVM